jgi:hypothetical protein
MEGPPFLARRCVGAGQRHEAGFLEGVEFPRSPSAGFLREPRLESPLHEALSGTGDSGDAGGEGIGDGLIVLGVAVGLEEDVGACELSGAGLSASEELVEGGAFFFGEVDEIA